MKNNYNTTLYYNDKEEFTDLTEALKNYFGVQKNSDAILKAMQYFLPLVDEKTDLQNQLHTTTQNLQRLKTLVQQRNEIQTEINEIVK
jgi:hypothetical protein